ncbi:DNAJ domain-containing protein [Massarina eburnea CBS 473.64]|uniref:DNAJ domain-containing protein n=1 Tax=Massarina eburnea CBS 473.64 TaxID=1395130 RepID=A0A6A6SAD7_9PLEO|nr:DNAJ domain-containing protein [Massarina eburnea CBS 473.64]
MRSPALLALLVCLLAACAAAWSKEDHEIFRLRDDVVAHNGPNVSFYDLLGVKPSASQDVLTKAWRKKSKELHPDKARKSFDAKRVLEHKRDGKTAIKPASKREIDAYLKEATINYQRLSVIAELLKGPDRERYDHFLRNGFPKWRGSGYYYSRFRPGLGSVMLGLLVVMGGGMHYFYLLMTYKRQREFLDRYIRHARKMAWGDDAGIPGIPGIDTPPAVNTQQWNEGESDEQQEMASMNRRQKRAMDKGNKKDKKLQAVRKARSSGISTPVEAEITSGPQGAKKRVVAQNGKLLIVDSVGNVFLEQETKDGVKQELLLDPNEEFPPTIYDTMLFRLPKFLFNQSVGRLLGNRAAVDEPLVETSDLPEDEAALQAATAPNLNGEARKRRAKGRGGR